MKTNPSIIGIVLLVFSIVVYMGGITPLATALQKSQTALSDAEIELSRIEMSITQQPDVKGKIAALEKTNAVNRATWMSPMLNSYAMRAKSLLDSSATEAGLTNVEYEEGDFRALPVPREQLPKNRTARRSVKLKARADYAAAASFLLRVEKEHPLVAVQSLTIRQTQQAGQQQPAEQQDVEMVLEWPSEGEVIK